MDKHTSNESPALRPLDRFDDFEVWIGKRTYPPTVVLCLSAMGVFIVTCLLEYLYLGSTVAFRESIPWRIASFTGLLLMTIGMRYQFLRLRRVIVGMAFGLIGQVLMVYMNIFVMDRIIFVPFIVMFYLYGVQIVAPLISVRDYAAFAMAVVIYLAVMLLSKNAGPNDWFLLGTILGPALIFLAHVVQYQRKTSRQLWAAERENFIRSTVDGLTQVLNRRAWYERSAAVLQDCRRIPQESENLSFLMLDIDHFKKVNDTWGHECGDLVIRNVSSAIMKETRENDVVGRLGGEEFGILLARAPGSTARVVAERIRRSIEAMEVEYNGTKVPVTVSLGLVKELENHLGLEELVRIGDSRLYEAKRSGRNRVVG